MASDLKPVSFVGLFLFFCFVSSKDFLLIDFRERKEGRGREKNIDLSFHLLMRSLVVLVCALTGSQTRNFGISGQGSHEVSYQARVFVCLFVCF